MAVSTSVDLVVSGRTQQGPWWPWPSLATVPVRVVGVPPAGDAPGSSR